MVATISWFSALISILRSSDSSTAKALSGTTSTAQSGTPLDRRRDLAHAPDALRGHHHHAAAALLLAKAHHVQLRAHLHEGIRRLHLLSSLFPRLRAFPVSLRPIFLSACCPWLGGSDSSGAAVSLGEESLKPYRLFIIY